MTDHGQPDQSGTVQPGQPAPIVPAEPKRAGRPAWMNFVLGAVGVLVLVGVATAAVVALQRAQFGPRMATAEALPVSTAVYMSFDLEGVAEFDRVIDAFDSVAAEAGLEPGTDVLDLLDEQMLAEFGMQTADFEPWIGRDVGVAVLDLDFEQAALGGTPGSVVVAASVRSTDEADAFMPRMVAAMEDLGMEFTTDSYQDVELWVGSVDPAVELDFPVSVTMARSGDVMLLGSHREAVVDAIDAQQGDSLRDAEEFTRLVDELPGDRAITLYLGPALFRSFEDLAALGAAVSPLGGVGQTESGLTGPFQDVRGMAMSVTVADAGVRFDFVQEAAPGSEMDGLTGAGSETIAEMLPAETFLYFGIGELPLDALYDGIEEALAAEGAAGQLEQFEAEFGLDIRRDIVDALTGEMGLGLVRSVTGPFVASGGPPVGGVAMLGLADRAAFRATVEQLNLLIAGGLGLPPEEESTDDGVLYTVPLGEGESLVYGISGDFFAAATDRSLIEGAGGDRLVDGQLWQDTVDALDAGGPPLFYVDIGAALDVFDAPPDARADLAPLRSVAAAASGGGDGIGKATLMVLIDF